MKIRIRCLLVSAVVVLILSAPCSVLCQNLFGDRLVIQPKAVVQRYKILDEKVTENLYTRDLIVNLTFFTPGQTFLRITYIASRNPDIGVYYVTRECGKYTIAFAKTSIPIRGLRENNYKVVNAQGVNVNSVYALRKNGRTFELLKKTDQAERLLDLFNKWNTNYQIPRLHREKVYSMGFSEEKMFGILEQSYTPDLWWSELGVANDLVA